MGVISDCSSSQFIFQLKDTKGWTSLVVQWSRILPVQGTTGASPGPRSWHAAGQLSQCTTYTEPTQPTHWAHMLQLRKTCALELATEEATTTRSPHTTTRKKCTQQQRPSAAKNKLPIKKNGKSIKERVESILNYPEPKWFSRISVRLVLLDRGQHPSRNWDIPPLTGALDCPLDQLRLQLAPVKFGLESSGFTVIINILCYSFWGTFIRKSGV